MVFRKLHELIYFQQSRYPSEDAFNQKILGRWEKRSTDQFISQMNQLSIGLHEYGLKKGDRVGILASHGSTEFFVIDMACLQLGLVTVPVNPKHLDRELAYILSEIDLSICFVNEDLLADRLVQCGLSPKKLISFGNSIRHKSWTDLVHMSATNDTKETGLPHIEISEEDLATIIYTSGSTGLPKGVMLSHGNIISNIRSIISLVPINYRHKVVSYLPLSHIFERMVLYTYVALGTKIFFIQDPKELLKSVQQVRPDYLSSVPRILELVHDEIYASVKKSNAISRFIVRQALKAGEREVKTKGGRIGQSIQLTLADFLVYRRWRKVLGGRIKGIIVGAASMPEHIARLFTRAGIPVKEGYGLTETSPVISFNRFEPGGTIFGTVGIPIPSVEVRIDNPDEDGQGEILVRGPNVMLGYYNQEELTKSRINEDGWFSTGDVGRFVHERFLKITDRKKDIFKTSSGQYIYPTAIENTVRVQESIDQCMVVGFQRSHIALLIIPNFLFLKAWCKRHQIHWTAELYMVENDRVKSFYESEVAKINEELKSHEKVRGFKLLSIPWSVDTGEYTPTLKLRRSIILDKYSGEINKLYN